MPLTVTQERLLVIGDARDNKNQGGGVVEEQELDR
jgi:hypothetical protein